MSDVREDSGEQVGAVLTACRRLLRPLVRILLRHGVPYRQLAALCKEVYVEVASGDYGLRGRPTNVSRMALLTGLDRKEIKRLRDEQRDGHRTNERQARQDRLSRVLSAWYQDPEFSLRGRPIDLPLDGGLSFALLAERYAGDVPATTLLKELKRAGAVVGGEGGLLRAVRRYYMPAQTDSAALERAGSVLEDLGSTVAHNLLRGDSGVPRFERRATNTRMDATGTAKFREFIEREGQEFLERVDAWLSTHEVPPDYDTKPTNRLGVGLYWIEDPRKKDEHN